MLLLTDVVFDFSFFTPQMSDVSFSVGLDLRMNSESGFGPGSKLGFRLGCKSGFGSGPEFGPGLAPAPGHGSWRQSGHGPDLD
jgi:hypothetical protein